jgi:hypothetical protein
MDNNLLLISIIVLLGIAGFYALARTLLGNWRFGSRGKEEVDARQSELNRNYEQCYNECMASKKWDPDKQETCSSVCRSQSGAQFGL